MCIEALIGGFVGAELETKNTNMAEKKKIFVVSGFHFHPYEHEHDIITEVFNTREKAAKCISDILTDTFPDNADDFSIDGCMYGNNYCTADDEEVKLEIEEFTI